MESDNLSATVIVATYNQSRLLERCLDSIVAQNCSFPYSIHVVDDASTDNTKFIIQKYKKKYPGKIKSTSYEINQYQNGFPPEFPIIEQLETTHIAFCDGDDYWISEDKLECQLLAFKKRPELSIVHTGYLFGEQNSNGTILKSRTRSQIEKARGVSNALDFIKGNEVKKSTAMFRKTALDMNFLSRCYGVRAQDWLVCACAALSGPIAFLDEETTVYSISPQASYQRLDQKVKLEIKNEVRWYCAAFLPDEGIRDKYRTFLIIDILRRKISASKGYLILKPLVLMSRILYSGLKQKLPSRTRRKN